MLYGNMTCAGDLKPYQSAHNNFSVCKSIVSPVFASIFLLTIHLLYKRVSVFCLLI